MKNNSKIIGIVIISVVIGFIIGWLIFSGIAATGNATKSIKGDQLNLTVNNIMSKGVTEDSSDAIYVKKLLTNNGYTTTDGRTYINNAIETTTVLCYNQNNEDRPGGGSFCSGSCTGWGSECINNGCQLGDSCACSFGGSCYQTSGSCSVPIAK